MDVEREVADLRARVAALEAAVSEGQAAAVTAPRTSPAFDLPPRSLAQNYPPPPGSPAQDYPPPPGSPAQNYPPPPGSPAQNYPPPGSGAHAYPPPPGSPAHAYPPPGSGAQSHLPAPGIDEQGAASALATFEWGVEALLRWAGVLLVSLAGIFLVSTAVSRGWIGPELQLLGATLTGFSLLAAATRLAESHRPWALALGCGGSAVVAVSALAAHEWLDLVGPSVALALVGVASLASIGVALRAGLEGIGLVACLMGTLAPLDTLDGIGSTATLIWLGTWIVASCALGLVRTWPGVRLITGWVGAIVLALYALAQDVEGALVVVGMVGALIIGATLWVGPTLARRLSPRDGAGSWGSFDWQPLDYRSVGFVPVWGWAVLVGILAPMEDRSVGLAAIAVAVAFLVLVAASWRPVCRLVSITTMLGALVLLAIGFAVFFDGPALMVALAGQAIGSYYLSRRLDDRLLRYSGYLAGSAASLLATSELFDGIENEGFVNFGSAIATLLVVLCWVGAARFIYSRDDHEFAFELPFVGAWIGAMLWLAAALLGAPQGLMLVSVGWTLMACGGLVVGLTKRSGTMKNVALGTLAVVLLKLVSVDMAGVDVFWRVGLFFVVGTGLIALGFKVPSLIDQPSGRFDDDALPDEVAPSDPHSRI